MDGPVSASRGDLPLLDLGFGLGLSEFQVFGLEWTLESSSASWRASFCPFVGRESGEFFFLRDFCGRGRGIRRNVDLVTFLLFFNSLIVYFNS